MKLTPQHRAQIKNTVLGTARAIRAEGRECAAVLLLYNSTPAAELGGMTAVSLHGLDKDRIAAAHQHYARAPDIGACVLIQEAWIVRREPGQELPIGRVAEQPDRAEVLMVNVLSKSEQWLLTARIDGKTIADAEFEKAENGNFEGRFIRGSTV